MEPNPYGLQRMWLQGDPVTRAVAVLLVGMSIASWYRMLTKAVRVWLLRRPARAAGHQF